MGMIIFLMAVIVEISFAVFCIITKSNHIKERSIIRIASFAGFVLFAMLPVIDWSLRYYALASLLLSLSIIGAIALIQKKEEKVDKNSADMAYKLVDIAKIGVMGHSLGGSAALGIGRIRADVNAVIALESPFMYDIEGIEDEQFVFTDKIYPVPVLNVYSDSLWSILGERPQYAANYRMIFDTDATAFNVYISGVGHLALTDFALTSPFLTRILDGQKSTTETVYCLKMINKISLEFFDTYLKVEREFTSSGTY